MGCFNSKEKKPKEHVTPSSEERPKNPKEKPKEDDTHAPEERSKQPAAGGSFATELLDAQNKYRSMHGADPLTLEKEMCKEAQKYAEHLAELGSLSHADTNDGENLAFRGPTLTAQEAADMWYNEIKDYDFHKPGFTGGTGHFTQVVWAGSKQFGAGYAEGNGGAFAVGRYRPAGNITNAGQFEANVLPAK